MKQFKLATSGLSRRSVLCVGGSVLCVGGLFISVSLLSSTVFAHILMKDEVSPSRISYNWTGLYGGLNIGAVQHTMYITDNQATTFNATIQQTSNPHFTGGFQLGYRRQMDLTQVSGVYGVEFSAEFSNDTFYKQYGSASATYQLNSTNELNDLCLLELIGGIAAERTLLFLAAGLSWTNISGTTNNVSTIPFFNSFSVEKKPLGATVGGGVEYAINDKFSARLKVDVIMPNTYSTSDNIGDTFQISNNIVQATFGVNYKFA